MSLKYKLLIAFLAISLIPAVIIGISGKFENGDLLFMVSDNGLDMAECARQNPAALRG